MLKLSLCRTKSRQNLVNSILTFNVLAKVIFNIRPQRIKGSVYHFVLCSKVIIQCLKGEMRVRKTIIDISNN